MLFWDCAEMGLLSFQLNWLNRYYETIRKVMGPELDRQELKEEKEWMLKNTEPFVVAGSHASTCSSTLTLVALVIALLHNVMWTSCERCLHLVVCTPVKEDLRTNVTPYAVSTEQLHHIKGCTAIPAFFFVFFFI